MRAVWTAEHRLHQPSGEVWIGVPIEGDETPPRGEVMREVIESLGVVLEPPSPHGSAPILAVHDPGMVGYLETAYEEWEAAGYLEDPGQDRVVAYVFPHPDAVGMTTSHWPASPAARAGVYCMDTTTVIGPGTQEAARAAADACLTAADLVLGGERRAYAAVRPPGHHAGTTFFGGSCYLNNAAIAAQHLVSSGVSRVGIIDIDAHHGNGTQQIFYDRDDVFYGSIHVDPGAGWFPHFAGFADEVGEGPGRGHNRNIPLAPGTETGGWLAALARLLEEVAGRLPEAAVVSLGVDAWVDDPESPLRVGTEGFTRAGEMVAELDVPVVFVQEGGYDLDHLGRLVVAVLAGFEAAEQA